MIVAATGREEPFMHVLEIYPALDLLGGRCVRSHREASGQVSMLEEDPLEVARRWRDLGARWLHLVDLDGARDGKPAHTELVAAIAVETGLAIQVGGGLREEADIAATLDCGATRVVLGTAAASDPQMLEACLARWGERIAVSVDARGDAVTVAGWLESATQTVDDFAARMVSAGVSTLLMTEVERDGTLATRGNARLSRLRAAHPAVRLIAGGGIASEEHIRQLSVAGMDGVVLGRALYDGTLDLTAALRAAAQGLEPPVLAPAETNTAEPADDPA
jgi:phosphoribosylformimino-5-aminoimidazole carboxamide ribotide isomerase